MGGNIGAIGVLMRNIKWSLYSHPDWYKPYLVFPSLTFFYLQPLPGAKIGRSTVLWPIPFFRTTYAGVCSINSTFFSDSFFVQKRTEQAWFMYGAVCEAHIPTTMGGNIRTVVVLI